MTSKKIAQTNQQQKSEKPQASGILQRAAVRSVSDTGVQLTDDQEAQLLSNSALSKDFSRVPISTTKPQQFQARNLQSHAVEPIQVKITQEKGEMTGDRQVSLEAQQPNKNGLPAHLKTGIENLSSYSMEDVRVHYNSDKPAQLQAYAYTQGTEIHVAPGQEKHLPHEAWHVVQQKQGRVKPTMQMIGGFNINDDARLEKEADVMGNKALQYKNNLPETNAQRKLQKIINSGIPMRKARAIQRNEDDTLQIKYEVIQLARWKLISKDNWTGIDSENVGKTLVFSSDSHPIGSIIEDTTNTVINPISPGGTSLPSGSYGDWRKVARKEEQVDHFPPNAAYEGTQYANVPYTRRPAFPIRNREGHRPAAGEEYGFGGHVSTTNSTFVQRGYTPDLNTMMRAGNFFGAMKKELTDKSNVALYNHGDRSAFNELLKPGISLSFQNGWITENEYLYLLSMLEHFKERPKG